LSRERAHRKFIEDKLADQTETLEAAQRRIDVELANLAKRIGENTQALDESLPAARGVGEPAFAGATY